MPERRVGVILHGITGRMGYNQHLVRSICAIREQGGVGSPTARARSSIRSWSGAARTNSPRSRASMALRGSPPISR
jgi:hypothetical protein